MGVIHDFNPVKLFVGALVSNRQLIPEIERRLTTLYGAVDHRSEIVPFDFTDYYEKEMGASIDRVFFSFETLIQADRLPAIKRATNALEEEFFGAGPDGPDGPARPVNLDPGYLENAKVVLASTKNFYHRIYLGEGIFGEVTMRFTNNTFQFFPWTYPDYQSPDYLDFFIRTRQIYRSQLKNICQLKPR
jgi:hypothetical protein